MRVRPVIAILCAACVATTAFAEEPFNDHVSTLPLSQELDARGALGGVTVDRLGFLYVANFSDKVWRISPEGEVVELASGLYGSSGNAVGSDGDLFQANFFGNTIDRISRTGETTRFASEGLQGPVGIAIDPEANLYVCNCNGNYIAKVTPEGVVSQLTDSDLFACPNGIAFGPDENLYVVSFNHQTILRVSPQDGAVEEFATTTGGAGNAHIAFSKGFFYVTRNLANRIDKISLDGEVFPLAGTGAPGHDDGTAAEATFFAPNGIAASLTGDALYVNTVVGERGQPKPSTITVRTIELMTLTKALDAAMAAGGVEAMAAAYERYSSDPIRGKEDTVAEMIAYGYRHLSGGQFAEAMRIFGLNAEAHPGSAAAQYQLGEANRYLGNTEVAIEQYRKTLALDPEHPQAPGRLAQLGAEP